MKKEFAGNSAVWATVYDGHSHIERRVYIDEQGKRYIKINGEWFNVDECRKTFDIDIWF